MPDKNLIIKEISNVLAAGNFDLARQKCQQALQHTPNDADLLNLMGVIAFNGRNLPVAATYYEQAIRSSPNTPAFYSNLALVYEHSGQSDRAISLLKKAVELDPGLAAEHARLGTLHHAAGLIDLAQASYEQALRLTPGDCNTRFNLASLLQSQQQYEAAVKHLEKARKLQPGQIKILTKLVDLVLTLGDFDAIENLRHEVILILENARSAKDHTVPDLHELIFYLPYLSIPGYHPNLLSKHLQNSLPGPVFKHSNSNHPTDKRIRLGYISPHFGNQPISHVTRSLYGLHDRNKFEVNIYSLMDRSSDPGSYLEDIKNGCDRFVDLAGTDPGQAAKKIHDDEIDILIDLTGYMPGLQLPILSRRPAPAQLYWLGHGGGLGLPFIDYVIADETVIPGGEENLYTEHVIRLPDCYHSTDRLPISGQCPPRSSFGLSDNALVFCAFNNPIKIDREVFAVWMRILKQVPGSQLWLSNLQQLERLSGNLRAEARKYDIDPDRLVFARAVRDKSIHLARHQLADLFLDTFSYNASTTALDALWGGLPLLTLKGPWFQSRIAASMLKNIGLEDMICESRDEYAARAVELARQPALLNSIRDRLWKNRDIQPLFNTQRFVHHMEDAYQSIWQKTQMQETPKSFDVPLRNEYASS